MSKLYVIGMGYKPFDKRALEIIRSSDIILANDRLLEVLKGYEEFEDIKNRLRIINNVYETMEFIKSEMQNPESRIITLLASGDPLFFGIGRMVVREFDKEDVEILPDLSSIQVAFARIKEAWSDAFLMSLHTGPDPEKRRSLEYEIGDIPHLLKTHHKIGILTDKENNPSAIANKLSACGSDLKMFVCERLGYPDEKITEGVPEDIAKQTFEHPNVVIIIQNTEHRTQSTEFRFGLREDEIQHSKGMITKDEVRAVTTHKLRLPEAGILWDIGAGSGSISIEAARLCHKLEVFAIEKNEDRIKHIENNKESFGIRNLRVIKGEAPQVLDGLPTPDRVFIGGSGGTLDEIVRSISEKMRQGIVVINAVTIETLNSAMKCLEEDGFRVDVTEVSVSKSKMINQKRHMSALNPIFIVKGER
ncbi:MAG: precorrin-6y C5,15-methyltransferase (decarboxylating) subunit CbiE [Nitrospirota bacterium]